MADLNDWCPAVARRFGANATVCCADEKSGACPPGVISGHGLDTVFEAVGLPATFQICQATARAGGAIASRRVHGCVLDLHRESLWDRNITITARQVGTASTPTRLDVVTAKKIGPTRLVTHRFKLEAILDACETFGNGAKPGALKVFVEIRDATSLTRPGCGCERYLCTVAH
jgi:alcohol dehydrogenase